MKEGWNVVLRYDADFEGMSLWIAKKNKDGSVEVVEPINLSITKSFYPGESSPEPTIRFHGTDANEFLRGLADSLVNAGFKPDELKASDKQLEAVSYHLEDMRKIAFKRL